MAVKISYNHSSGYYTIYTDEGSIQFGGFSELQELLRKESFSFLGAYALNRTFLKKVACKHHRLKDKGGSVGKDGRSAIRRFDVPLKADVRSKVYSYKKVGDKVERVDLYRDEIELCKYNMSICVLKAQRHHDLSFFKDYFDAYKDFLYYSTGRTYVSKKCEEDAYKRFLNLVG